MSDYSVRRILIERDGYSADEADRYIEQMRQEIEDGEDPEELLFDLGLEPDYLEDLIGY